MCENSYLLGQNVARMLRLGLRIGTAQKESHKSMNNSQPNNRASKASDTERFVQRLMDLYPEYSGDSALMLRTESQIAVVWCDELFDFSCK